MYTLPFAATLISGENDDVDKLVAATVFVPVPIHVAPPSKVRAKRIVLPSSHAA
jgi:hypothetical protein